jgi:hypothetical protein
MKKLIKDTEDLLKQAKTEKSHYYTAKILQQWLDVVKTCGLPIPECKHEWMDYPMHPGRYCRKCGVNRESKPQPISQRKVENAEFEGRLSDTSLLFLQDVLRKYRNQTIKIQIDVVNGKE